MGYPEAADDVFPDKFQHTFAGDGNEWLSPDPLSEILHRNDQDPMFVWSRW